MILSRIEYDLNQFKLFSLLNEFESVGLNEDKMISFHKRGTIVYREGCRLSGFYFILDGIVKIYKNGLNGRQQILNMAGRGDIIAYRSLLDNETSCTSAKVISDAALCRVSHSFFKYLIENNPRFSKEIIKITCKELGIKNDYLVNVVQKSVRERTAEVLLLLLDKFSMDKNGVLQIRVTREDLANMVGTVTESLIRVFSELRSEGLVDSEGRNIKILNPSGLEQIAKLSGFKNRI